MANEELSQLKIDKSAGSYQPYKRRKRLYLAGVAVVLILAAILYMQGVFAPAVQVEASSVTQMYPSQTFTLLNASGYVVAQRKAAVASKITGRLISISVEEGSKVKEGQVIAKLESDDVAAARDQAEANLNAARYAVEQAKAEFHDAKITFERNKELVGEGYIAQAEYDASEARFRKAKAGVSAAEAAVQANVAAREAATVAYEYTFIRAPFDSVVLTKNADIGDIVTPIGAAAEAKAAVVTIADMNSLQVEVDVSESNIQQVQTGQPCEILLDALPEYRFRGAVHMIVPTADRTKATVMVKIRFIDNDHRILPEMSAKVAFLSREVEDYEKNPRTVINPAAVTSRKDKKIVFLITDNRAIEKQVTLGERLGDMVEVLSGVKTGDRIVLNPPGRMRNGQKIAVAEK